MIRSTVSDVVYRKRLCIPSARFSVIYPNGQSIRLCCAMRIMGNRVVWSALARDIVHNEEGRVTRNLALQTRIRSGRSLGYRSKLIFKRAAYTSHAKRRKGTFFFLSAFFFLLFLKETLTYWPCCWVKKRFVDLLRGAHQTRWASAKLSPARARHSIERGEEKNR